MQWIKGFYDKLVASEPVYDAVSRRRGADLAQKSSAFKKPLPSTGARIMEKGKSLGMNTGGCETPSGKGKDNILRSIEIHNTLEKKRIYNSELNLLKEKVKNYEEERDVIERERDAYYSKLRDIEILSDNYKAMQLNIDSFVPMVQKILFSNVDDKITFDAQGRILINQHIQNIQNNMRPCHDKENTPFN